MDRNKSSIYIYNNFKLKRISSLLCYFIKIAAATDTWNLQCRMQSIARACNRSLAKPVTSFFELQPINSSGDNRGLCTTPLESLSVSILLQYTASGMGSFAMLTENQATMISQARIPLAREKHEKRNAKTLQTINAEQEMENQLKASHFASFHRYYSTLVRWFSGKV